MTSWGHSVEQGWTVTTPRLMAPRATVSEISALRVPQPQLSHVSWASPPPTRERWTLALSFGEQEREKGGVRYPGAPPTMPGNAGCWSHSLTSFVTLGYTTFGAQTFPGSKQWSKMAAFPAQHPQNVAGGLEPQRSGGWPRPLTCHSCPGVPLETRGFKGPRSLRIFFNNFLCHFAATACKHPKTGPSESV